MAEPVVRCTYTKLVPIAELKAKFHPKNPNVHPDDQLDRLAEIIRYQGIRKAAVLSNRSDRLTAGHGRIVAAERAGAKVYPVDCQDYENEEQEFADLVADNALNDWSDLNLSAINSELPNLGPDFDLDMLGIKDFVLEPADILEPQCDEDEVPENADTRCKPGDVWQLGRHRLMCGDSTAITDVEKLMAGEKAELCFTSPPYADQREYNGGKDLSTQHLATFIRAAFNSAKYFAVNLGYSRRNGEVNQYWDDYILEAKNCGLKFLSWNIWDKGEAGSIGNQTAMFAIQHEWIFVFGPEVKDLNLTVANKNKNKSRHGSIRQADGSLSPVTNTEEKVRDYSQLKTVLAQTPQKARNHGVNHPAMFPVEFPEHYIEAMTTSDHSLYEPFGGSGSTLIACEKTNRRCFMMEIDPHYCDVILARWEKYTGKTAERLEEGANV